MKYLFILVLVLLNCISSSTTTEQSTASTGLTQAYYDGCQYVVTDRGGITHKGNCSNSHHK